MLKFGTDGIRGIVDKDLDKETIFKIGCAVGKKSKKGKILICKDNRLSSDYVSMLFCSGALSQGANIVDIGYMATPAVSYFLSNMEFNYGVMISASHNPSEYNGIKIFNKTGRKIYLEEEKEFEKLMLDDFSTSDNYGKFRLNTSFKNKYFAYLRKIAPNLNDTNILLDCSNGVTSYYAKDILSSLGANVTLINGQFNGKIINVNAGILNYDKLRQSKIDSSTDYALAVDGDGDRICIIDKYNNILDGDTILYLLTYYYKNFNRIKTVVGTTQTNLGIEKSLNSLGINLIRSDVGDKNLIKEIEKSNLLLGAEQSGHIIIKDYLNSGDGLLAGLITLRIIKHFENSGEYLNILNQIKTVPQVNLDLVYNKPNLLEDDNIKEFLKQQERICGKDYRMVVRKSGSEKKIRIMVEGIHIDRANIIANDIFTFLKNKDTI